MATASVASWRSSGRGTGYFPRFSTFRLGRSGRLDSTPASFKAVYPTFLRSFSVLARSLSRALLPLAFGIRPPVGAVSAAIHICLLTARGLQCFPLLTYDIAAKRGKEITARDFWQHWGRERTGSSCRSDDPEADVRVGAGVVYVTNHDLRQYGEMPRRETIDPWVRQSPEAQCTSAARCWRSDPAVADFPKLLGRAQSAGSGPAHWLDAAAISIPHLSG